MALRLSALLLSAVPESTDMASRIETAPKAELHMHLEGALEPSMLFAFARRNGIALPYRDEEALRAAYQYQNLQGFLDLYYAGLRVLCTERDYHELTLAYLERAYADRVVHAEVFISPQGHLRRGVPMAVVLDPILDAFDVARDRWGMTGGLIVGGQRHLPEEEALAMLDQARPWRDRVLGLGLGGAEVGNPPQKFVRLFAAARDMGWRTCAHAGEEGPAEYVRDTLDLLKVDRIDHGVRAGDDPHLVARLAEQGVPLTVCPLSNVCLRVFPTLRDHNMARLLRAGVVVTVNSDDPPYFHGYLNDNYVQTAEALELSDGELHQLARNSFEAAFMDDALRARRLQELDAHWQAAA